MASNMFNWVELAANDISRAMTFYEKSFDLKFKMEEMGPLKLAFFPSGNMKEYGASGALVKGPGYKPSHEGTLPYIPVPDIEAALKKVSDNGGKILSGKKSIGQYGNIGIFEDTEGNRVGLHSM
ncbi:VOC family protein [Bdellovibrio sp. KM01]|uniref:VOC family protein n=1 Tax=Bdellovibrio sp. KM01 TaxID=2748865 RepID=UPI00210433F3|nr:VOC family protein [Bdellovibrio sp. KM01]